MEFQQYKAHTLKSKEVSKIHGCLFKLCEIYLFEFMQINPVFLGKGTRKTNGLFFLGSFAFFWLCLGLSQLVFPNGYDWLARTISEEGNHAKNPVGWIFFTIGVCTTAVLLISQSLYIYRHLYPNVLLLSRITLFFLITGSIGLFIVGSVSEEYRIPHDVGAFVAFGGFGLGAFCTFLISIRRFILKESWPKVWQFLIIYTIIWSLAIIVAWGSLSFPRDEISRYQWLGLWIIMVYFIGMNLLIPAENRPA